MHDCKKTSSGFTTRKATLLSCLFIFFAFIKNCLAQTTDCDQILMTELDSLSQELTLHAKKNIIVSEDTRKIGFAVYGAYMHETVTLTIHSVGAGACVNEGDKVRLVFTDSTTLELANMGKFNCQAVSSVCKLP